MRQPSKQVRHLALWSWALVACVVLPVICAEAAIELILRHPQAWPGLFRPANRINHIKNYYMGFDRSIVQFRPDCAMYDDALIYRLRPGTCTVRNREHTVEYAINHAGVRDTDDKLTDHSILVIGDSMAMGWGVARDATLSERLAALTGRKVLNAAISSYETVREMRLLRQLVQPDSEYIVIGYDNNDYFDNWTYLADGVLPRIDHASYDAIVRNHLRDARYYPFKHLRRFAETVLRTPSRTAPALVERPGFAAMAFLAILDSQRDLLRARHVIVFEANAWNNNSSQFADALRHAAVRSPLLGELASLHVLDASTVLTDDDYFLIDDHMRGSGHAKIARLLADAVQGDDRWRVRPAVDLISPEDAPADGAIERHQHVGDIAIISGWAARRDTGEPPVSIALIRDGMTLAEAEPVFFRNDIVAALGKPTALMSGFALAAPADRLGDARDIEVTATWADGHIARLRDATHGPGQ